MPYSLPYIYVRGEVVSGRREAASYLRKNGYRDQFREKLKIDPHHGTLNLKLDDENTKKHRDISWHEGIRIEGFEKDGEHHGAAEAYPAKLGKTDCAVVIPEERKTHRIMELVSNVHLRRALGLRNGDLLDVKVFIKPEESWL
ncbi:MAG: DUF120 domain-containing protein [Candidatus Aenigmatarchaeota archaeon]